MDKTKRKYLNESYYPIYVHKEEIIQSVADNLITLVSSPTGSGKSTQIPQYLLQLKKRIIVSEPRKIACISISNYIKEFQQKYVVIKENEANYYSPFNILFLTETALTNILSLDPILSNGDILFIDEVHERTINLELILYFMKYYTFDRKNFRLVIGSATFNPELIINYFNGFNEKHGIYTIEQKEIVNYDIIYNDNYYNHYNHNNNKGQLINILNSYRHKPSTINQKELFNQIRSILNYELNQMPFAFKGKTVLIFLPDYKSIKFVNRQLIYEFGSERCEVFELVGALNKMQQFDIINCKTNKHFKIILSTTLAESSVTIYKCNIVIDSGLKKVSKYNNQYKYFEETLDYISQDLAIQRAGRCGRNPSKRGTCYRIYSQSQYNNFLPFREPDSYIKSINIILLKLFNANICSYETMQNVEENGALDFMSPIEKKVFNSAFETLIKTKAIIQRDDNQIHVNDYGHWLIQNELEPFLGRVLYHYCFYIKKSTKEIIQLISLFNQSNSCDLFYFEIDSSEFQLGFPYEKNLINELMKELITTIISEALNCHNPLNECKIKAYDRDDVYYSLFTELDVYYNAKNLFTQTQIFSLGELMISLFFLRQYNCLKCHFHYNEMRGLPYFSYQINNQKQYPNDNCNKCRIVKQFYCRVYSLNPNFFESQQKRLKNILKTIPNHFYYNSQLKTNLIEQELANWNTVYIYLICKRPSPKELLPYQLALQLNQKIKEIDFKKLFNDLYTSYKQFYINFGGDLIMKLTDNSFLRKDFNGINLYFGINNEFQRVKLYKTFFLPFFQFTTNYFFGLIKINKIGSDEIYLKNINPIFPEMLNRFFLPQYNYNIAENKFNHYSLYVVNNIGKYFFVNFLKPKFTSTLIEYSGNSLNFIFSESYTESDKSKEIEEIESCIKREKNNFVSFTEDLICLSKGCLMLTISQGLNVVDINTFQKNIIYTITANKENTNGVSISQFEDLCNQHQIKYSKIFQWNDQVMIAFQTTSQSIFFIKAMSQYNDYIITPYKNYSNKLCYDYEQNDDSYGIYGIQFNHTYPNWKIRNVLMEVLNINSNDNDNYIISSQKNNKVVYCYLHNNTQGEYVLRNNGFRIDNKHTFQIKDKTHRSSRHFYTDFNAFLAENSISIISLPMKPHFYQILNYTPEKKQLIDQFINETEIQLNQFALIELKSKAKDTFLYLHRCSNLVQYGRERDCNINVIFFENKIVIYGALNKRNELKRIIANYFSKLMEERVLFSIGREQQLSIRGLKKKAIRLSFAVNVIEQNDELKIECRKQYIEDIKKIIGDISIHCNSINENNQNICEICLENLSSFMHQFNYLQLRLCGHSFCVECLKMQIVNQINLPNCFPIKCIKCNEIISNSDIKEVFTQEEMEKISYALIKVFISSEKGKQYKWCQNPNCNYIYVRKINSKDNSNIRLCPNCNKRYCLICEGEIVNELLHNKKCRLKLLKKVNYLDRKWMIKNTKNCPVCNSIYEKAKGCNHITCINCVPVTHFCYICGKVLNRDNPLSHFSDPNEKCCNMLYVEIDVKNDDNLDEIEEIAIDDDPKEEEESKFMKIDTNSKDKLIQLMANVFAEGNEMIDNKEDEEETVGINNDMENYLKYDNRKYENKHILNRNKVSVNAILNNISRNEYSQNRKKKSSQSLINEEQKTKISQTSQMKDYNSDNSLDDYFTNSNSKVSITIPNPKETMKTLNKENSKSKNNTIKEGKENSKCNYKKQVKKSQKQLTIEKNSSDESNSNDNSIESLSQYFVNK